MKIFEEASHNRFKNNKFQLIRFPLIVEGVTRGMIISDGFLCKNILWITRKCKSWSCLWFLCILQLKILFLSISVPSAYEDSLKASSVIIPTSVLDREDEKYNNNNNNNINSLTISNTSSSNSVALKIEEVSNETSNLMIEDRQNTATRWISFVPTFTGKILKFHFLLPPLKLINRFNDKLRAKWQQ